MVGGCGGKGLLRQTPTSSSGKLATQLLYFFSNTGVIGRRGHNCDMLKVLGGRADHRRPTDINVFDQLVKVHTTPGRGLLKGVKVDHNHVNARDSLPSHPSSPTDFLTS